MDAFSPLCTAWHHLVKETFSSLHGHQSKTFSLFVLGAIRAKSIVVAQVAEALLEESEAKAPSIERRLQRFLSNKRIKTHEVWKEVLQRVLSYLGQGKVEVVIDVTSYGKHAQVIYLGILVHSRALPLAWKVMPGQTTWDQGMWSCVEELVELIQPYLGGRRCTLIGDSAFGCFPMVKLCERLGWHYLFRICPQHTYERFSKDGRLLAAGPVAEVVSEPNATFFGHVRLWQEDPIETELSGCWEAGEEEPLLVISDQKAGRLRLREYRRRGEVEAYFEDLKSRGWDWEESHVRRLDRLDRLLLVLSTMVWWLAHLGASCIHNGRRDRYDRHDRRDKSVLRIGRLYLLDIERRAVNRTNLMNCLLFRKEKGQWIFSIRF